jgi:uncharacterized membrane protein YgdD (TMEM256/DUF423 family)
MNPLRIGALYCAAAVAAGAFGAHALAGRLDARALAQWETAARYLMYGGLGLLLAGAAAPRLRTAPSGAATSLALGSALFALTVGALALGGPRWLGAVTPLGGAAMIAGFAWLAVVATRRD